MKAMIHILIGLLITWTCSSERDPPNPLVVKDITDTGTDLKLDTEQLEFAFSLDLTSMNAFDASEVLSLSFESKETKPFKFINKVIATSLADLSNLVPKDTDLSDFNLTNTTNSDEQHYRLFFNKKITESKDEKVHMIILLKFAEKPISTQLIIRHTRPMKIQDLVSPQKFTMLNYVPYYFQATVTTLSNLASLMSFSDEPFNVYDYSLTQYKSASGVNFHLAKQTMSIDTYIFEFYGPVEGAGKEVTFNYQIIAAPVVFNATSTDYPADIPIQCSYNAINSKIYYMFAFTNKNKGDWLYLNKEYGVFDIKYHTFQTVAKDGIIMPGSLTDFKGPIQFNTPYFIFEATCPYPGYYPINFIQKPATYELTNDKTTLFFEKGNHKVALTKAKDKNLEIRIINIPPKLDQEKIDLTYNEKTIEFFNNSTNLTAVKETELTVNNPFASAVLEFRISGAFVDVTQKEGQSLTDQFIYYKLQSQRAVTYHFEFTRIINNTYKVDYGYGFDGFLPKPAMTPVFNFETIMHYRNPLISIEETPENNFHYIAFDMLESSVDPYSFRVKMYYNEFSDADLIPNQTIVRVNKNKIPLKSLKSKAEDRLYLFYSKTEVASNSFVLSYLTRNYTIESTSGQLGIVNFQNEHLPYDLRYLNDTESKFDYCLSYSYLPNGQDFTKIDTILKRDDLTFTYSPMTYDISWSSVDSTITKYRIYLSSKEVELSNECNIFKLPKEQYMEIIGSTSASLRQFVQNYEEYNVNILAMGEGSLHYMKAFKSQSGKRTLVAQMPEPNSKKAIDFKAKTQFNFFIEVPPSEINKEGVILLSFKRELSEAEQNQVKLNVKIVQLSDVEEKGNYLPTDEDTQFKFVKEESKYFKLYYKAKVDSIDQGKKVFIIITTRYILTGSESGSLFEAEIAYSKANESRDLSMTEIKRYTFNLTRDIPRLYTLTIPKPLTTSLFLTTNSSFILYKGSVVKGMGRNDYETGIMTALPSSYEGDYVIEFFEHFKGGEESQNVTFQSEAIADQFTSIDEKTLANGFAICNETKTMKSVVYGFNSLTDYSSHKLIINQLYGSYEAFFTNRFNYEGANAPIIPSTVQQAFKGVDSLGKAYFLLKVKCKILGDAHLNITKSTEDIILVDQEQGNYIIGKDATSIAIQGLPAGNRNIEVRLLHEKAKAIQSNEASVIITDKDGKDYTLTESNRVARIEGIDSASALTLKNSFELISLNISIGAEAIYQLNQTEETTSEPLVFAKLNASRAPTYKFAFDRDIDANFLYEIGKGTLKFIPTGSKNIQVNADKRSFTVNNPYYSFGELSQNEFYYATIKIPSDYVKTPYKISISYTNDTTHTIAHEIELKRHNAPISLNANKDPTKVLLTGYASHCGKEYLQLNFTQNSIENVTVNMKDERVFSISNDRVSYDMTNNRTGDYLFTYAYLTTEETASLVKKVSNPSINYSDLKLTWEKVHDTEVYSVYIIPSNSNVDISTECAVYELSPNASYSRADYSFNQSTNSPGKYKVNVMAHINNKLSYQLAYKEIEIDVNFDTKSSSVGMWVGISLGIVAVIVILLLVFFIRKKKRLENADNLSQLIV